MRHTQCGGDGVHYLEAALLAVKSGVCALIELEMQWVWSCRRLMVGGRLERPRAMEEGEEFVLDCICMASLGELEGAKVEGTLPVRVFR